MKRIMVLMTGLTLLFLVSIAQATIIGPGTDGHDYLHVGDPVDGPFLFGGTELVSISATHLQIENESGGKSTMAPLWLIIGVANDNGTGTAPKANGITAIADGAFTSGFLYTKFGITGGGSSQSFVNWSGAELALTGITATEFGIYAYDFSTIGLSDKGIYDVTFDSPLANGTFALAIAKLGVKNDVTVFAGTPFTETGFFGHQVPEPGAFMLFGAGLVSVWFLRRRFEK